MFPVLFFFFLSGSTAWQALYIMMHLLLFEAPHGASAISKNTREWRNRTVIWGKLSISGIEIELI